MEKSNLQPIKNGQDGLRLYGGVEFSEVKVMGKSLWEAILVVQVKVVFFLLREVGGEHLVAYGYFKLVE